MKRNLLIILTLFVFWTGVTSASTLWIKADVANAEVFLDGSPVGRTPLAIDPIAPGQHQLRLVRDGFKEATSTLDIPASGLARVFITMEAVSAAPATLPQTVPALHQHKAGVCAGTLVVAEDGLHFEAADKKDVFHIPWKSINRLTRGMGSAPNIQWALPGEQCGLRVDAEDRNYGFLIYDETPEIAQLPPDKKGDKVTFEMASKPTERIFNIAWQIWLPIFKATPKH
jgi:hypothetical protein